MEAASRVVTWVVALAVAAGNLWFWWWVVRTGEGRFQAWVERRYQVTIGRGLRGHWQVTSGGRSSGARFAIELLQVGYFMGAFVVWAVLLGLGIAVLLLVQRR